MKRLITLLFILLLTPLVAQAGDPPTANAVPYVPLGAIGDLSAGFAQISDPFARRLPRYSTPVTCDTNHYGWVYFDTDDNTPYYCSGSAWIAMSSGATPSFTSVTADYFRSSSANPATVGIFRVANNENALCGRNAANSADLCGKFNASNELEFTNLTLRAGSFIATGGNPINMTNIAGDAGSPANGDVWYNTSTNKFRCRENGATADCIGSGSSAPFADNAALVKNNSDNTKLLIISAASIGTGTTRTATAPNKDFTFAGAGSTLTNGTIACVNSAGNFETCSAVTTGLILASFSTTTLTINAGNASGGNVPGAITIAGGNNTSANTVTPGLFTLRGGDQTAAATGGAGGGLTIRAGDSAGNGSAAGGDLNLRPGGGSAATPALPGKLIISETYGDGGTVTQGKLACMAGDLTVADCATSATNAIGLTISASDTNPVIVQLLGRNNVAITLDVTSAGDCNGTNCTTTVGHYVCTSANTAGTVQVATGPTTAPCAAHRIVGIIVKAETSVTTLAAGNVALRLGAR